MKVKKLSHSAVVPSFAKPGDAGMDLVASHAEKIGPGETKTIWIDIAIAVPVGHVGMVCSRSGMASKASVFVLNAPGIIDSGYRGEVGVILHNAGKDAYHVQQGDRVAQLLVVRLVTSTIEVVDSLDETERGEGGFGHTGE